jgi:hypothetical protein
MVPEVLSGRQGVALALGSYLEPSLKSARQARDDARKTRQVGTNPVQQRKADKLAAEASSAITFEAVPREFYDTKIDSWSPLCGERWIVRMEKDLFPLIGSLALASITAAPLLDCLRRVEKRGALELAHNVRQTAGHVFRYGFASLPPAPPI